MQHLLLTLLSSTQEGKTMEQVIGEHIALDTYSDVQKILSDKLDKIVECYELKTESEILAKSGKEGCDPTQFTAEAKVPLPFGDKLSETITLVVD